RCGCRHRNPHGDDSRGDDDRPGHVMLPFGAVSDGAAGRYRCTVRSLTLSRAAICAAVASGWRATAAATRSAVLRRRDLALADTPPDRRSWLCVALRPFSLVRGLPVRAKTSTEIRNDT